MKKTILIILMAIALPATVAAKIGDYAGVDCATGMEYCDARYLSDKDETFKRIHNLEYEVELLKQQAAANTCSCAGAAAQPDLEQRVSALERVVEAMQRSVIQTLQLVIGIIQSIIK